MFIFLHILLFAQAEPPDSSRQSTTYDVVELDSEIQELGYIDALASADDDFSFDDLEEEIQQDEVIQETPQHALGYYLLTPAYWVANNPVWAVIFVLLAVFLGMAFRDFFQQSNPLKRNFPPLAMGRYVVAALGPSAQITG